jgi:pimeloyl-ACP methyl ester carboxylesterase
VVMELNHLGSIPNPQLIPQPESLQVLHLCLSQNLRRFDVPLLQRLARHQVVATWEYQQSPDEGSDLALVLCALDHYLQHIDQPIHLIGHGLAGMVAWLYASRYPAKISSVVLLSVGRDLSYSWHSHYYSDYYQAFLDAVNYGDAPNEMFAGCPHCVSDDASITQTEKIRPQVLQRLAFRLFGYRDRQILQWLGQLLAQDLDQCFQIHSLKERIVTATPQLPMPVLVCGAADDPIFNAAGRWQRHLQQRDRQWISQHGGHFFHYTQAALVSQRIEDFWRGVGLINRLKQTYNLSL